MSIIEKLGITQGPWHVMESGFGKKNNHPTVYATNNDLNYVATCADYATIEPVNNMANARLIAAAPEMLEALIDLYDDWKHIDYTDPDVFVKPIIEKATGKTWEEIQELLK